MELHASFCSSGLTSGGTQMRVGEQRFMLLSPALTLILTIVVTRYTGSVTCQKVRKGLTDIDKMDLNTYIIIEILPTSTYFLVSIKDRNIIHTFLPVFQFSMSINSKPIYWPQPKKYYISKKQHIMMINNQKNQAVLISLPFL